MFDFNTSQPQRLYHYQGDIIIRKEKFVNFLTEGRFHGGGLLSGDRYTVLISFAKCSQYIMSFELVVECQKPAHCYGHLVYRRTTSSFAQIHRRTTSDARTIERSHFKVFIFTRVVPLFCIMRGKRST